MLAQEEARRLGHNFVGTEQILLGLVGEGTGVAAKTLKSMGVRLKDARIEVEKIIGRGSGYVAVEIPFTATAKRALELSWDEARQLGHNYIGTEHLLLGLLREDSGVAVRVLQNLSVNLGVVHSHVIRLLSESGAVNPLSVSLDKFNETATRAIILAQEESRRLSHNFVGTEQLLIGLIGEGTGTAAKVLKSMGVNLKDAQAETEKIIGRGSDFVGVEIPVAPLLQRVLDLAWEEAQQLGHHYIGTEHLLLGLIREKEGVANTVLQNIGVDCATMRTHIMRLITEAGISSTVARIELEQFTEKAIKVVMLAREEARRLGHNFVGTEQILLGLIGEGTGVAAKTLKSMGVRLKDARIEVEKIIGRGSGFVAVEIPFTPRAKRVLELSWDEARQLGYNYIGTEHLLLGIIREGEGVAARVLENLGVDLTKVRGYIVYLLSEESASDTAIGGRLVGGKAANIGVVDLSATSGGQSITPTLDQYCVNLSQAASDNKWAPIVGRQQEMDRIIQILGRHAKDNAILIGEPGVGKTAIARGLAAAIANDDVPETLLGRKLIMLNMASLAAESNGKGELENNFRKIMNEISKTSNLILVIDELQMLWRETSLSKDSILARIFARSLCDHSCSFIGITSLEDYRNRFEQDAVLKNYCQPVIINPTSVQETVEILRTLKERYEQHHHVTITNEAIEQAVSLSDGHISERCLPDKAIDLIDEASSWVRQTAGEPPAEYKEMKGQLRNVRRDKEAKIRNLEFEEAATLREQEVKLSEKIRQFQTTWQAKREKAVVGVEAVEHVLHAWIGKDIPK